jgi:hypothetical protein
VNADKDKADAGNSDEDADCKDAEAQYRAEQAKWVTARTNWSFSEKGPRQRDLRELLRLAEAPDTQAAREDLWESLHWARQGLERPNDPVIPRKVYERVAREAHRLISAMNALKSHYPYWYWQIGHIDLEDIEGKIDDIVTLKTLVERGAREGRKRGQPARGDKLDIIRGAVGYLERVSPTYQAEGNLSQRHRSFIELYHDIVVGGSPDPEPLDWQLRKLRGRREK